VIEEEVAENYSVPGILKKIKSVPYTQAKIMVTEWLSLNFEKVITNACN